MQGLHHVAKNEMIIGLPSFERVAVSIVLPLMSVRFTDGRAADAVRAVNATAAVRKNFLNIYNRNVG